MATVHIICGSTGAGKTTYARQLAVQEKALRFSIDPWMQTLFSRDAKEIHFDWMMERINRCEEQIWEVTEQALELGTDVILDLGFTTREHRHAHMLRAKKCNAQPKLHFLDVPADTRRTRVKNRNVERDPAVFALEVTDEMFDFMEERFERPTPDELVNGEIISS